MRLSSAEVVSQKVDELLVKCSPKANQALWGGGWRTGVNQAGILRFNY